MKTESDEMDALFCAKVRNQAEAEAAVQKWDLNACLWTPALDMQTILRRAFLAGDLAAKEQP